MTSGFEELIAAARKDSKSLNGLSRHECLEAARTYAGVERRSILNAHRSGASGTDVMARLTSLTDRLVSGTFELALCHAPRRKPLLKHGALCAVGGYGRGEMNPYSDVDIALLYQKRVDANVRAVNEFVVPFLWDAGYANSFVVRTVKETVALTRKDLRVHTGYTHCRLLEGRDEPLGRLRLALQDLDRLERERVVRQLAESRRAPALPDRYIDIFAPQPSLKEQAGGLRDYHAALWILALVHGVQSIEDVVGLELLSPEEHLNLLDALDLIWRIRNDLHFRAGRCEDRLTYANQQRIALSLGYTDESALETARLMSDYYRAAKRVREFFDRSVDACRDATWTRPVPVEFAEDDSAVHVVRGRVELNVQDSHWFEENPARLMAVFYECARLDTPLGARSESLVRRNVHLAGESFRSNALVRRYFLAICNRPLQAGRVFRQMAACGLLGKYIPEFAAIQGIIRYEDFHQYPVDEHTLRVVEAIARIPSMEGPAGEVLRVALEHLTDPYVLVLALLFHDLGKAQGEIHTGEGARLVRVIGDRIGMDVEDRERIAFLVQHHLKMTHIALYRDTDDYEIVEDFARFIQNENRLRALFLLSYADLSGVGPSVWNDWKGTLLLTLYLRTERVISGESQESGGEFWRHPKAEAVRAQLPDSLRARLDGFLRGMGERYFTSFAPDAIAEHLACYGEAEESALSVRFYRQPDTAGTEVVVCTRDHAGLFAEIAGCFASQLIDVDRAALFTSPAGLTVDCFSVVHAQDNTPLSERLQAQCAEVLLNVLSGRDQVAACLAKSERRVFSILHPPVPIPTSIHFDNSASRTYTVVDVVTGDRMGLLYDIASALAALGLDVSSARIVTDARRVRDSFYVTRQGNKIEEVAEQVQLSAAIKDAIRRRATVASEGDPV